MIVAIWFLNVTLPASHLTFSLASESNRATLRSTCGSFSIIIRYPTNLTNNNACINDECTFCKYNSSVKFIHKLAY